MTKIRVRFAPSPTGPLHIGGLRTALFNYLFARKHKGNFILRIEDTDQTRYIPGAEEYIINSLKWCNIDFDEGPGTGGNFGPYRQSERKEIYQEYADELINKGFAYYAFDTPEELENIRKEYEKKKMTFSYDAATRTSLKNSLTISETETEKMINNNTPYALRFKIPENEEIRINDLIRGEVIFNTSSLDDKVIFKSDGLPTYHLANIVDDYLMKITHVIRGEEWLPSLPLHIMLYRALGWEQSIPEFAHLPLILKPSGKGKLSKRDGDREGFPVYPIEWKSPEGEISKGFREWGYFPEAFLNILAFLGWNPGTEQEIFSKEELINNFSLEKVGKAGARFNPEKAKWYNQQYLKNMPDNELADSFAGILKQKNIITEKEYLVKLVTLVKERVCFINEFWEQSYYFFKAPDDYDPNALKKSWKDETPDIIYKINELIQKASPFNSPAIENIVKEYTEKAGIGFGKVMNPLRILIVGSNFGPHLFDIMELLGKEEVIKRIENGLKTIIKDKRIPG
jgi:glutamyl-tRNA synthetase